MRFLGGKKREKKKRGEEEKTKKVRHDIRDPKNGTILPSKQITPHTHLLYIN